MNIYILVPNMQLNKLLIFCTYENIKKSLQYHKVLITFWFFFYYDVVKIIKYVHKILFKT